MLRTLSSCWNEENLGEKNRGMYIDRYMVAIFLPKISIYWRQDSHIRMSSCWRSTLKMTLKVSNSKSKNKFIYQLGFFPKCQLPTPTPKMSTPNSNSQNVNFPKCQLPKMSTSQNVNFPKCQLPKCQLQKFLHIFVWQVMIITCQTVPHTLIYYWAFRVWKGTHWWRTSQLAPWIVRPAKKKSTAQWRILIFEY